jgi:tRNA pseudouridine38-40 synthase
MTQRYKITFSYDGTNFQGLQVQPNQVTVQGELERALLHITRQQVRPHACGRTDTGVHARAMVAHFDLDDVRDVVRFRVGLNAVLPPDIRVHEIELVGDDFHARFNSLHKEYRYFIWNADVMPPFKRLYALHDRRPLDIERMREAAAHLVGEQDFKSFCCNAPGQGGRDGTVRTIYKLEIRQEGDEITIVVDGSGFLYKMVRTIAGFLMRVGRGEMEPSDTLRYLENRTRTAEIPSAQAHGLFMWQIWY